MTIAVDLGRKATQQTNKKTNYTEKVFSCEVCFVICPQEKDNNDKTVVSYLKSLINT